MDASELYRVVTTVFPETDLKVDAVKAMLDKAAGLGEGPVMYLQQITVELMKELLETRHSYHVHINDYEFYKRILAVLAPEVNDGSGGTN